MKIKVIGMDPSLSNWGFVKAEIDVDTNEVRGISINLAETKPGANKKTVRKNSDDLRRARILSDAVKDECKDVAVAFVEVPVGSQSAAGMKSYGVCIGVLSTLNIPMIQVSPEEVKLSGAGRKTSSKEEMIAWATEDQPHLDWYRRKKHGVMELQNKNEHVADALAAIYAGMNTEDFQSVVAIARMAGVS